MFVVIVFVAVAPPPLAAARPADEEEATELALMVALSIALTVASPVVVVTFALVIDAFVVLSMMFTASDTPTETAAPRPAVADMEDAETLVAMVDVSCASSVRLPAEIPVAPL